MNDTFRVSEQNREGGRRTAFPIAAVFALLSSLTLSVWFIVNLLTMYDYFREAGILWTLILPGLMVLLWIVMTICLLMRKRNAVLIGCLGIASLIAFWDLVRYVFVLAPERFNLPEFIGFTGYFGAIFLMWFFLAAAALVWFNNENGRAAGFFRAIWFFSGIMGILVAVGGVFASRGVGLIVESVQRLFFQVPFAFLMGWWITHPYVKEKPVYSAGYPYGQNTYAYPPQPSYDGAPGRMQSGICPGCGNPYQPGQKFCTICGYRIPDMTQTAAGNGPQPGAGYGPQAGQPYGMPYPGGPRVNPVTGEVDAPNTGMMILSFFFPGIGLILWLVWKDTLPQKAQSCGKGALIGFIVGMVLTILLTLLSFLIPLIIVGASLY